MNAIQIMTLAVAVLVAVPGARATVITESPVLTGTMTGVRESRDNFSWGDGVHNLVQQWSARTYDSSGWFYGLNVSWSTADVYAAGVVDPLTVEHAELFPYTRATVWASEGETVFFRGSNGYYGAWVIDNIYKISDTTPKSKLDGTWYFQESKTGDFTAVVPEAGAASLLISVTPWLCRRNRNRRHSGARTRQRNGN